MASTVGTKALAADPPRGDREPSNQLGALIEAHKKAYTAFGKAVRETGGNSQDRDRASRTEETALLAICAYAAVRESDRLSKAGYLLEIEARGELDLPEHVQALLRSTMWNG
ncbi:hypothetical protein NKJ13_23995 [Mesorhizobium sp. M0174]|uniref:hypothetical protein n=1 Tax=Mesorhizobium sp. M0174 TaxID=2956904 RepID=UPI00333C2520